MKDELIGKLKAWVRDYPDNADVVHVNLRTQKKFTIRQIVDEIIQEKERGIAIKDEETLETVKLLENWIGDL